jgi:hypothetical protein
MNDRRDERLQVMLSPEELAAVDDFRFKHRMFGNWLCRKSAAFAELLNHPGDWFCTGFAS